MAHFLYLSLFLVVFKGVSFVFCFKFLFKVFLFFQFSFFSGVFSLVALLKRLLGFIFEFSVFCLNFFIRRFFLSIINYYDFVFYLSR